MTESEIDHNAKIIWDYMLMDQQLPPSDLIFVLCSFDTRIAEWAADLYQRKVAPKILLAGGSNPYTRQTFQKSEAETFADIILAQGVPAAALLLEDKSTNTGENVRFGYSLLKSEGALPQSVVLVQKPYMIRRSFATFMKQWPGDHVVVNVSSPPLAYDDYFDEQNRKEMIINTMVGDMQRIREYPKVGYQIEQLIPEEVWQAYEELVAAGYTKHLIKD